MMSSAWCSAQRCQARRKDRVADVGVHLLVRMVLHLKLDARALARNKALADDAALNPYLAVLADDDTLGIDTIEAFRWDLDDDNVGLVCEELFSPFHTRPMATWTSWRIHTRLELKFIIDGKFCGTGTGDRCLKITRWRWRWDSIERRG